MRIDAYLQYEDTGEQKDRKWTPKNYFLTDLNLSVKSLMQYYISKFEFIYRDAKKKITFFYTRHKNLVFKCFENR